MERFLAAVALTLLDFDGLSGRLNLDPIEVQMEAANLFEALGRLDKVRVPLQLSVARDLRKSTKHVRDLLAIINRVARRRRLFNPAQLSGRCTHLKMVFLLAHKRVIGV
jgi:hypothetical protein